MAQLHLLSPKGFKAAGVYAGIKSKQANDVGLLICDKMAAAAAVFTTNKVFAAPVKIGKKHIASGKLRGVVVNSGNANACTGKRGEVDAVNMCKLAADQSAPIRTRFLPSSTGIIGHALPMDKVSAGIVGGTDEAGDVSGACAGVWRRDHDDGSAPQERGGAVQGRAREAGARGRLQGLGDDRPATWRCRTRRCWPISRPMRRSARPCCAS